MNIKAISAYNFRNFENINISEFRNNIFIYGENGAGKTNFLELLYFSYVNKSFRSVKENLICKNSENFFSINLEDNFSKRKIIYFREKGKKVNFEGDERLKKVFIPYFNSKYMIQFYINTENRRFFLDKFYFFIDKEYQDLINEYYKELTSKKLLINSSLEKINIKSKIFTLNENFSKNIYKIVLKRELLTRELNEYLNYFKDYWNFEIRYNSIFKNKEEKEIVKILNDNFDNELRFKRYKGIHNDKYEFLKDGIKIEINGSFADFKIFFLLLNFSLMFYYKKIYDFYPIILCDDYFNEIDKFNILKIKEIFFKNFYNKAQLFYTSSKEKEEFDFFDINYKIKDNKISFY